MDKIKELYEKVAKDSALQAKFNAIVSDAENEGQEATEAKLVAFAKDAGYEVSVVEMQEFFKALSEEPEGVLSDMELDMVAGGKSAEGIYNIVLSVGSVVIGCSLISVKYESAHELDSSNASCKEAFE
jgi:predicted ribosomally synthesized peptide with nif11-like leader